MASLIPFFQDKIGWILVCIVMFFGGSVYAYNEMLMFLGYVMLTAASIIIMAGVLFTYGYIYGYIFQQSIELSALYTKMPKPVLVLLLFIVFATVIGNLYHIIRTTVIVKHRMDDTKSMNLHLGNASMENLRAFNNYFISSFIFFMLLVLSFIFTSAINPKIQIGIQTGIIIIGFVLFLINTGNFKKITTINNEHLPSLTQQEKENGMTKKQKERQRKQIEQQRKQNMEKIRGQNFFTDFLS